jgi:hypothetical protein
MHPTAAFARSARLSPGLVTTSSVLAPARPDERFGDEALVRYGAVLAPARLSFPLATKLIGTPGIKTERRRALSVGAGVCPPPS